ncbi:MAG: hypothetical protein IJW53_01765 [Clostridia bacterium]|nr:hypothetical protein [Clostridia bacterium]
MIIHSYENGLRADACIDYLRGSEYARNRNKIVLLPIPTTKDKCTIFNTKVYIDEVLDEIYEGDVVSCYGLPENFSRFIEERGAVTVDLSFDEEFLLENAELTALSALGIFLGSTRLSPREVSVGIVGYGRIGKKLTSLFLFLGAKVRVFTSRESTRLELCEWGVASAVSAEGADLSGLDLLINTAPAPIFRRESIPEGLRIMELASGENFDGISGVERYPSVPAKMFPYSAGRAWGRAIERHLREG